MRLQGWVCLEIVKKQPLDQPYGLCWRTWAKCDAFMRSHEDALTFKPCRRAPHAYCFTLDDPYEVQTISYCFMSLRDCYTERTIERYNAREQTYGRCQALE